MELSGAARRDRRQIAGDLPFPCLLFLHRGNFFWLGILSSFVGATYGLVGNIERAEVARQKQVSHLTLLAPFT
jgi:hypothetical protein